MADQIIFQVNRPSVSAVNAVSAIASDVQNVSDNILSVTTAAEDLTGSGYIRIVASGLQSGDIQEVATMNQDGTVAAILATKFGVAEDYASLKALNFSLFDQASVSDAVRGGDFSKLTGDQSALLTLPDIDGDPHSATVSAVNTGNGRLTATAHGLQDGQAVIAKSSDAGLTADTVVYYARRVDANTITLHPSYHAAHNNTGTVTLTALSANMTLVPLLDPGEGIYVIPDGLAKDGSEGCWIRNYDSLHERYWGVVRDGVTEEHNAIQMGIQYAWGRGGGIIEGGEGIAVIGDQVHVWQSVTLSGQGGWYSNLYSSTDFRTSAGVIEAKAGLNKDLLIGSYMPQPGEAQPTTADDVRHQGGIRNYIIHGYRDTSLNPQDRAINSSGSGLLLRGISNFELDENVFIRCAEHGVEVVSRDYGSGTPIQCNNMYWGENQSLGNHDSGLSFSGGDSDLGRFVAGYNGDRGIITSGNTIRVQAQTWNNQLEGFYNTGDDCVVSLESYDNNYNGCYNSGARFVLDRFWIMRNGQEGSATALQKAGLFLASGSDNVVIGDGVFGDDAKYGPAAQNYPIYTNAGASISVALGNFSSFGHTTSNVPFGLDYANVRLHPDLSTNRALHPGFVAGGRIDFNSFSADNIAWLASKPSGTAAYASSVLTCNALASAYSTAADNTVTDIAVTGAPDGDNFLLIRNGTSANTVTFTHNSSKIRCPDAADFLLGPYEAILVLSLNSTNTIWQIVGTAV